MNDRDRLTANVRAELARARVSAASMDRRLGFSRAHISRRLLGVAEFRAQELHDIARELGIPVDRLFQGVNDRPADEPDTEPSPAARTG